MNYPGIAAFRLLVGDVETTITYITTTHEGGEFGLPVTHITVQAVLTEEMIKEARKPKVSTEEVIQGLEAIKDDLE